MKSHLDSDRLLKRFQAYISVEHGLSLKTAETYTPECRRFLSFLEREESSLPEVTSQEIISFILLRKEEGIGSRTTAKILSCLRSFFRFLIEEGMTELNPVEMIDLPKVRPGLPEVLSEDEVELLLSVVAVDSPVGIRDRALFELVYSSGLRVSEAVHLYPDDLFLSEGYVRVMGKGSKERIVPVGEEGIYWLKKYQEEARPLLIKNRTAREPYFISQLGKGISRKGIWKRFKEAAVKAGLSAKVHTLRHSFASHLLKGGANLREVQELLGHADITTTQIYTHLDRDDLKSSHHRYHPRG